MDQFNPKNVFPIWKNENHHRILHILINLGFKFQLQQTILIYGTNFSKKRRLPVKNRKNEHHHWIIHIQISLRANFQPKLKILIFWTKVAQNGVAISTLKLIKWTPPLNSACSNLSLYQISLWTNNFEFLNQICRRTIFMVKNREKVNIIIVLCTFELVLVPNFSLNWQFWFFGPHCQKRVFMNRKSGHYHWILHIQISLDTKIHFKLTILTIFWTKFSQKRYFRSKTEKVNITMEFCIFGLVQVPNFSLKWQFWVFGTNLPKMGISSRKQNKQSKDYKRLLFV